MVPVIPGRSNYCRLILVPVYGGVGPVDYFNKWFLVKEKPEGQGQESLAEEEQESAAAEEQQQPPAQQVDMRNIAEHCATVRFLRDHEEF